MDPISKSAPLYAESELPVELPSAEHAEPTPGLSSHIKSPNEYYAIWDDWEKSSPDGKGEKRDIAVQRLKDCLERQSSDLNLFSLNLSTLPELPPHINLLEVSANRLTELPTLPMELFTLSVSGNQLISLPDLPESLVSLRAAHNKITQFPKSIPPSMVGMDLSYNEMHTVTAHDLRFPFLEVWINIEHNPLSKESLQWLRERHEDLKFYGAKIHFTNLVEKNEEHPCNEPQ